MKAKLTTPLLALALAAFAVAGCGGDDNGDKGSTGAANNAPSKNTETTTATTNTEAQGGAPAGGKGEKIKVDADLSALKFDKPSLDAKAGSVTLVMDNPSSLPHAIAVEGNGVDKDGETVMKGGTSTVTVDLKPGSYDFYCPVDGHRQAGMEGKLTVK